MLASSDAGRARARACPLLSMHHVVRVLLLNMATQHVAWASAAARDVAVASASAVRADAAKALALCCQQKHLMQQMMQQKHLLVLMQQKHLLFAVCDAQAGEAQAVGQAETSSKAQAVTHADHRVVRARVARVE